MENTHWPTAVAKNCCSGLHPHPHCSAAGQHTNKHLFVAFLWCWMLISRRDPLKISEAVTLSDSWSLKHHQSIRDHMMTVKKIKAMENNKTVVATETHTCMRSWMKGWKGNIQPQSTCPGWFLFDQMAYIRWYIRLFIEAGAGRKQLPCVRVTGWHPPPQQDLPARQIERKLFIPKLKRDTASYHSYSIEKLIIHAPCGKDSTMKLG